jgi:hypothetical protein
MIDRRGGWHPEPREFMHKGKILVGLFLVMCGIGAFISMMGNPRVSTLHGSDVLGLIASGLCLGFGSALVTGRLIFRRG